MLSNHHSFDLSLASKVKKVYLQKKKSLLALKGSLSSLPYYKLLEEETKLPFKCANELECDYAMNQRVSK